MNYYLAHSGVPGQKPGVQHGPPYPLSAAIRAMMAREAKERKDTSSTGSRDDIVAPGKRGHKIEKLPTEKLRDDTARLRAETEYIEAYNKRYPQKKKLMKRILEEIGNEAVKSLSKVAVEYGKKQLTNFLYDKKSNK